MIESIISILSSSLNNRLDKSIFKYTTLSHARLCVKVDILPTCERHVHDRIISLRGKDRVHITSLTPPLSIEVHVASERSCIVDIGISF